MLARPIARGYFILPFDLIPGLGFTDDMAAIKLAYKTVFDSIILEIQEKIRNKLAE